MQTITVDTPTTYAARTRSQLRAIALFDATGQLTWSSGLGRSPDESLGFADVDGRPSREQLLTAWLRGLAWAGGDAVELPELGIAEEDVDLRAMDGRLMRLMQRPAPNGGSLLVLIDRTDEEQRIRSLDAALTATRAASTAQLDRLRLLVRELRTPLQTVLGFAQLMDRDRKEPLPLRHRTRVEEIVNGGEQLRQLLDELLDLARRG